MTLVEWLRAYERGKDKKFVEMFDSNGDHMFDATKFFDTYVDKFPIGTKREYVFYDLPYWEHLKIFNLLYAMHIFKNVSSS